VIVLDASAAVEVFSQSPRGVWLADRLRTVRTIHVPVIYDLEILNSLRGLGAGAKRTPARIREALDDYASLRVNRYDILSLRSRIWALRHNLTAYDAAYVALAEALDAPLVTADARLARSSGHAAELELVP